MERLVVERLGEQIGGVLVGLDQGDGRAAEVLELAHLEGLALHVTSALRDGGLVAAVVRRLGVRLDDRRPVLDRASTVR